VFFDNHKNNDTFAVDKHLELISEFFTKGKSTESGDVEELIIENMNIFEINIIVYATRCSY
jgi:phosphopantetheine adenylyltransferase